MNTLHSVSRESDTAFWTWRADAGINTVPIVHLRAAWDAGRADMLHAVWPLICAEAQTDADQVVRLGLQNARLTQRETQIVGTLARLGGPDGHPVPVDTLLDAIIGDWQLDLKADTHNLRVHVSRVRFKAERFGVCVGTIYCHGYRIHRATQGALCRPPYRHKMWGHVYTPLCQRVTR